MIAGDFPEHTNYLGSFGARKLITGWNKELDLIGIVKKVEVINEESKKRVLGTAGWGFVGAAALGPVGLLTGVLAGGNKNEVCFACYLKDGRKFMAIADTGSFQEIAGLAFMYSETEKRPALICPECKKEVDKDWILCPYCSIRLKCGNCGTPIEINWKFCPKCSSTIQKGD